MPLCPWSGEAEGGKASRNQKVYQMAELSASF